MKKEFLLKLISLVVALSAFADTHFELLKSIGFSASTIDWIKFLGLIFALLLPSVGSNQLLKTAGIGGSNPPAKKDEK